MYERDMQIFNYTGLMPSSKNITITMSVGIFFIRAIDSIFIISMKLFDISIVRSSYSRNLDSSASLDLPHKGPPNPPRISTPFLPFPDPNTS